MPPRLPSTQCVIFQLQTKGFGLNTLSLSLLRCGPRVCGARVVAECLGAIPQTMVLIWLVWSIAYFIHVARATVPAQCSTMLSVSQTSSLIFAIAPINRASIDCVFWASSAFSLLLWRGGWNQTRSCPDSSNSYGCSRLLLPTPPTHGHKSGSIYAHTR